MKLKKNDLLELKKSGKAALVAKLAEAKLALGSAILNKHQTGEKVDLRATRTLKRSIAQLATLIGNIKE